MNLPNGTIIRQIETYLGQPVTRAESTSFSYWIGEPPDQDVMKTIMVATKNGSVHSFDVFADQINEGHVSEGRLEAYQKYSTFGGNILH